MSENKPHDQDIFTTKSGGKYPAVTARIAQAMLFKAQQTTPYKRPSWSALAKSIGLTAQAPINWKKGSVSNETLEKIAEETGVSKTWLITGEGNIDGKDAVFVNLKGGSLAAAGYGMAAGNFMGAVPFLVGAAVSSLIDTLKKNDEFESIAKALETLEHENPNLEEEIKEEMEAKITEKFSNVSEKIETKGRLVPIISLVAAGGFKEAILSAKDGYITSYLETLSPDAFCLEIEGMSMAPDFLPGDRIVCDPNVSPYPGDCVIAQKTENGETEATFKKYKPRGFDETGREYFELVPINPDYPIMTSKYQDIDIIATVVEHFRTLRRPRTQ